MTNNNTNIAGLAGGGFNNEIGCQLLTVKVFNETPWDSDTEWIANGINHAVSEGAKVINMSFYCPDHQYVINQLEAAYNSGVCLIAAAGNAGMEELPFPASHPHVLSVAASDIEDNKSPFSNYDYELDVCAPGGVYLGYIWDDEDNVLTLTPQYEEINGHEWYYHEHCDCTLETAFVSGTSLSAPYVSALAGLILSNDNTLTPDEVYDRIKGTADRIDLNSPFHAGKLGAGRINAFRALDEDPHPSLGFYDLEVDFTGGDNEANVGDVNIPIKFYFRNFWEIYPGTVSITMSSDDPDIIIETNPVNFLEDIISGQIYSTDQAMNITITDDAEIGWHTIQLEFDNETDTYSIDCPIQIYPGNIQGSGIILCGQTETSPLITNVNYYQDDEIIVALKGESDNDLLYFIDTEDCYFVPLEDGGHVNVHGRPAVGDLSREEEVLFDEVVVPGESGDIWVCWFDENFRSNVYYPNAVFHTTFGNDPLYVSIGNVNDDVYNEVIVISEDNTLGIFSWDAFGDHHLDLIYTEDFGGENFFPVTVGDLDGNGIDEIILSCDEQYSGTLVKVSYVLGTFVSETIVVDYTPWYFLGPTIMADINDEIIPNNEIFTAYCFCDDTDLAMRGIYQTLTSQGYGINTYNYGYLNSMYYKRFSGCYTKDVTLDNPRLIANNQNNLFMFDGNLDIVSESYDLFFSDYPLLGINSAIMNGERHYLFNNEKEIIISDDNLNILDDDYHFITSNRYVGTPIETDFDNDNNSDIVFFKQYYQNDLYFTVVNVYQLPFTHSESSVDWQQYAYDKHNSNCYGNVVNSDINSNTIWWKDVVIYGDVMVDSHCELIIKPGVKVRFENNASLIVYGGITAIGNKDEEIVFTSNSHSSATNYTGIILQNPVNNCSFEYCTIEKAQIGINIIGPFESRVYVSNCQIEYNDIGIEIYGGIPRITSNIIMKNDSYGVACFNGSNFIFESNTMINNQDIEFFLSCSRPLLSSGYNDLWFDEDYTMATTIELQPPLYVSQNWWGTTDVDYIYNHLLNDQDSFIIEPICEFPNSQHPLRDYDPSRLLYEYGVEQMQSCNYETAKNSFINLISLYPSCNEISLTLSKLLELYVISYDDLNELQNYYTTLLQSYQNYPENKILNALISMCKRKKSEFNDAITDYEFILMNNPTYEDSCYAVIDIGYTYLEAAQQRTLCSGELTELEPESEEKHRKNVETLLTSLIQHYNPEPSSEIIPSIIQLYNNYPNPFNPCTTISFSIPNDSEVNLSVYNIKGQKVKTLIHDELEKGRHEIVWYSKDNNDKSVASGVYFYKLNVNGKSESVRKCLLLK